MTFEVAGVMCQKKIQDVLVKITPKSKGTSFSEAPLTSGSIVVFCGVCYKNDDM